MEHNYQWVAKYSDGTEVWQHNDNGETKFGDLDFSKLKLFLIKHKTTGKEFSVDLTRGIFVLGNEILTIEGISNRDITYKLTYFRRVRQHLGLSSAPGLPPETVHCLGFNTTGKLGSKTFLIKINDLKENLYTLSIE